MTKRSRSALDWSTGLIAVLVVAAGTTVYFRDGSARFFEILAQDAELFLDMLPKTLAGCLIGAFVTLLLPREMVARWVGGESGVTGLGIAMVAGAILPGGPFTIYPVAGAFALMGADIGAIVTFITSWSLIGYSRALVWELPFFGVDFVAWRMVLALPLPIMAGITARLIFRSFGARPLS
jgi:uncharacterized membrane protein YraQ (UPF0718 family)